MKEGSERIVENIDNFDSFSMGDLGKHMYLISAYMVIR